MKNYLRTSNQDLHGQPDIIRASHESFFPHLLVDQVLRLPLRLRCAHNGHLTLGLLLDRFLALQRRNFYARSRKSNDVANVRALGANNGAHRIVRDVQVGGLLRVWLSAGWRGTSRLIGGVRAAWIHARAATAAREAHTIAAGGHHGHGMQPGEHNALWRQRLQIILVALTQFGADLTLAARHILNAALHRDNALQIEAVDVVDRAHRDLCVCVLHDPLDGVAILADYAADQVVVGQHFEGYFTVQMIIVSKLFVF